MKVSLMLIMGNIHAVEATLELYGSFSMRQAASLAPSAPHTVPIMPSAPAHHAAAKPAARTGVWSGCVVRHRGYTLEPGVCSQHPSAASQP